MVTAGDAVKRPPVLSPPFDLLLLEVLTSFPEAGSTTAVVRSVIFSPSRYFSRLASSGGLAFVGDLGCLQMPEEGWGGWEGNLGGGGHSSFSFNRTSEICWSAMT